MSAALSSQEIREEEREAYNPGKRFLPVYKYEFTVLEKVNLLFFSVDVESNSCTSYVQLFASVPTTVYTFKAMLWWP